MDGSYGNNVFSFLRNKHVDFFAFKLLYMGSVDLY